MKTICALIVLIGLSQNIRADGNFTDLNNTNGGGGYHIDSHFKRRVIATLTTTYLSPETIDGVLTVYAPIPPTLPMQHLVSCDLRCRDNPLIAPTTITDVKNPLQHYLRLDIPVTPMTLQHPCEIDMTYVVDLFSAKLASGPAQMGSVASKIPPAFLAFLRESSRDDFNSTSFQNFLSQNELKKTPTESNLGFAKRAFYILQEKMHFGDDRTSGKASTLCQTLTGNCGSYAIISASTLAANGVVAATFPGRWAQNEETHYGQFHCFNGFFEPSIGWITFDTTNKKGFGSVGGNFIAFSLTSDDCPEAGMTCALWQFQMHTYHGHSPCHTKCEDHWYVKTISQTEEAKKN